MGIDPNSHKSMASRTSGTETRPRYKGTNTKSQQSRTKRIPRGDRGKYMEQRLTKKLNGPEKTGRAADTGTAEGEETPKPNPEQTAPQCEGAQGQPHRRTHTGRKRGGKATSDHGGRPARSTRGRQRVREDGGRCGELNAEGSNKKTGVRNQ